LFTENPDDPWVIDTLQFLTQYFFLVFFYSFLILVRQMPALTRRGKRQLPGDFGENEEDPGDEMHVGILAQRARRRAAAQEQEAAQAREEGENGNSVSTA
jgi:hypothetical protein